MSIFDYDYEDLAEQVRHGLERIAVNFLRAHGARIRKDLVDFHGYEQIDLELAQDGHLLRIRQVGRPRGPGYDARFGQTGALEEEFNSEFDGQPSAAVPQNLIVQWLACLPAGEAAVERSGPLSDPANPFLVEKPGAQAPSPPSRSNPFVPDRERAAEPNPFGNDDRDRRRSEALRWLGEDD